MLAVSAGLVAAQRIDRPLPQPRVTAGRLTASLGARIGPWPLRGRPPARPQWPYRRWATAGQSGPEQPVPIASLTKMTAALVVLRDHPVPLGSNGPIVTITPDEAAQFGVDLGNDETNIPLQTGETLTELQLLEALLNQSADDAAYTLAVWDAGSQPAFVAKMNALAASLGAVHSNYVDASGFDPQSVSTAADTLRIAAAGMAIPTFASVAGMPTVNLPGVGTVHNIVTAIGTDGIVGVKSGYTSQASGCMVLAGFRSVDGRSVLVLASALGQREPAPAPRPSTAAAPLRRPGPTTTAPAVPTTTTTTAALQRDRGEVPAPLHRAHRRAPTRRLGGGHRAGAGRHRRVHRGHGQHRVGRGPACGAGSGRSAAPGCSVSRASRWQPPWPRRHRPERRPTPGRRARSGSPWGPRRRPCRCGWSVACPIPAGGGRCSTTSHPMGSFPGTDGAL